MNIGALRSYLLLLIRWEPLYESASTKPMIDRIFGQFVRVLVDMNITQTLRYKVLVERKGFAFSLFFELEYDNLPSCKGKL